MLLQVPQFWKSLRRSTHFVVHTLEQSAILLTQDVQEVSPAGQEH